jgi:NADP-dependent 3-hydroxy acid dehydrogenase YdfG
LVQLHSNIYIGGANGIGAATIRRLHTAGAKIIFGDFDEKAGSALAKELGTNTDFIKTDVSKYEQNLALFKFAASKYSKIDYAVAVAGVGERGDWFNRDLTVEDVEKPDTNMTVEINLLGVLYFVRIALPYLKVGRKEGEDKGLVLVGSAAGFRESPGLPVYQVRLFKFTCFLPLRICRKGTNDRVGNKAWRARYNTFPSQTALPKRCHSSQRTLSRFDRVKHDRRHFPVIPRERSSRQFSR